MLHTTICKFEGCGKPVHARELCASHYHQWRKQNPGATVPGNKPPPGKDEERPWLGKSVRYGRTADVSALTPIRNREERSPAITKVPSVRVDPRTRETLEREARRRSLTLYQLVREILEGAAKELKREGRSS